MIASEEDEEEQRTTVWIPRTSMERRYFGAWKKHKQRPFRSWNTVILPGKKDELLADISDYLNPGTARWYASKGIPWRRGYLFSGAPGSGKTSLALALAGKLGLDIYIVKLGNPDLGDSDLEELLGDLPQRSLVLLEDIDAAGIGQRRADRKQAELEPFGKETTQQLTLAGLLSAIDGITSNQGRILVMTTNVANSLDAALRRPGQIDVEVEFTLTTKEQIHGIFSHIYEGFRNVNTLATRFANQFPEKTYSAAETQEFLIQRKDTPAQAVEDVGKWHRAMLKKNNTAKEQKGISL
jgi:chaperone BCS1